MTDQIGLFEALYTTRALRRYKPDPVPDELLFQALDAAIRAPAGGNIQSWHFIVVRDEEKKRRIGEWYLEGWMASPYRRYEDDPSLIDQEPRAQRLVIRSASYLAHTIGQAPVLVFACGGRQAAANIFPAAQNFLLACRGLGLGSCLTTIFGMNAQKLAEYLGMPENVLPLALMPVGFPTDRIGPVNRRPVKDVVSLDSWGNTWPYAAQQPEEGLRDRWAGQQG